MQPGQSSAGQLGSADPCGVSWGDSCIHEGAWLSQNFQDDFTSLSGISAGVAEVGWPSLEEWLRVPKGWKWKLLPPRLTLSFLTCIWFLSDVYGFWIALSSNEPFIIFLKNDLWCLLCSLKNKYNSTCSTEEAKQGPALEGLTLYAGENKYIK